MSKKYKTDNRFGKTIRFIVFHQPSTSRFWDKIIRRNPKPSNGANGST